MADVVEIDEVSDAIVEAISTYTHDLVDAIPEVVDEVAKDALKDLRASSPRKEGDYAKGWRIKRVYSRSGFAGRVIHNLTDYQLTHLLEFGHALRNGGRARAFPHVAPVADRHGRSFVNKIGQLVARGGRS